MSANQSLFEERLAAHRSGSGQYSRPTEVLFHACTQKARPDEASLDGDLVKDICRRYDQAARLSCRYEEFLSELDTLYSGLATTSDNKEKESCFLLTPLIHNESAVAIEQTYSSDPTFRSRFCKAITLQAIATAAMSLAKSCDFSSDDAVDMVAKKMKSMWIKNFKEVCESAVPLSYQQKLECFEVYNFLYMFLLGKAVPLHEISAWWTGSEDYWIGSDSSSEPSPGRWWCTLEHFRHCLTPYDILHLVTGQSYEGNAAYPLDKTTYIYAHGIIDPGNGFDWLTTYERKNLLNDLANEQDTIQQSRICGSLWDLDRPRYGTPFNIRREHLK